MASKLGSVGGPGRLAAWALRCLYVAPAVPGV